MNKPLLGSIALATLLFGDASAATIYERFEAMEKEMQGLQSEVTELREKQASSEEAAKTEEDEDAPEDDEPEDGEESDEEEDDEDEEEDINEVLEEMQEEITELTKATAGSHLKLSVDFRTSYDSVNYEMADGSRHENNALLSNRLWLNMNWAANKNISFTGQLAYNKTYGERFGSQGQGSGFEEFDWIVNENPNGDGTVRVKSAYFFYRNDTFLGTDIPWTFSLGRRPSTNGHLINLREDDVAASPSGHTINVEFDGLSSKFGLEKLTGVEGMYVKFCAGQGASDAQAMFSTTPYAKDATENTKDIHLVGLIFVPYDDGQYSIGTQFYTATNLIDLIDANNPNLGFESVGDIYSGSMYMMMNGIGDELSDFLDDTTVFVSGAMSRTSPDDGASMLGSTDMENGYSYWVGLNMPSLISEDGRFGLEFNHGSKYWRPITYAEDTLIGSKVAARGDAYEIYFTEPLVDDILSLQIRYTYIDYKYSGSNGFFGSQSGTPMTMQEAIGAGQGGFVVDKAQDVRVYLRYRF